MSIRGWKGDLALGVRLAVGGGRSSLVRLTLTSLGIAVAMAVLLVAASIGTMNSNRAERRDASLASYQEASEVSPTYLVTQSSEFRAQRVEMFHVRGTAPDSPKPVGLPVLPRPGEMYVSPALADLLRSDEGELLRPRLPDRIVGTLDKTLVPMPGDLVAWVGADDTLLDDEAASPTYGFGVSTPWSDLNFGLLMLVMIGGVVVLLPLLIFISSASRIAGAERDRRLSALRLVGAGSRQVRRIAAAEALVGAVIGLALGTVLFLVGRQFAEGIDVFGERSYVSDVVPDPLLAAVVVLLVPVLSVLTALFALRRTIIEPLGVVRHGKPARRRGWWRFAVIAAGVALLVTCLGADKESDWWAWAMISGTVLLLVGVPILLPWLVERTAGRIRGGPPSWQLAIRRLQLDSGTSARVVGGVAIVLAGTIALQTMLLSMEDGLDLPGESNDGPSRVEISVSEKDTAVVERNVEKADGVRSAQSVRFALAFKPGSQDMTFGVAIADCVALKELAGLKDCRDGDVFTQHNDYESPPTAGMALEFRRHTSRPVNDGGPTPYEVIGNWTMPTSARNVTLDATIYRQLATTVVTPGALKGQPNPATSAMVLAEVDKSLTSDQLEGIRNTTADLRWHASIFPFNAGPDLSIDQRAFMTVRNTLFAGALFTLMVAGISLLVLALEHIRERRRPLAVLAASGVPTGVLGRSLLWQVALPIVLGVVVALLTGVGLAALLMRLTDQPLNMDWPGITLLCVGATVLTLLVSAMTLPFLRSATRLTTIRHE